jgi:hypothetical protein
MEEGIGPDILLSPAANHVRAKSLPTVLGILDESLFESNLTAFKFTDKPIVEGMGPVSLLPLKESCSKPRWKMLGGILEVRLLNSSKRIVRPGIFPRDEGIGPEIPAQFVSSNTRKDLKLPSEVGMLPVNLEFLTMKLVRDIRPPNVLGILPPTLES